MPRRCRRSAGVLGRGCVVSDRFYVPTHGSALATFRAVRAWIETRMKAEGKTLPDFWYADGPEDMPELYEDHNPEPERESP